MQLSEKSLLKLADLVSDKIVSYLEKRGVLKESPGVSKKSAYQRTEQLLYNYCGFRKIVEDRLAEIEEIRANGVPQRSASIVGYSAKTGTVGQIVLPEESVEQAIRNVQDSIVDTVQAIELIDKCMAALKHDPYYKVLEMRYFEGCTQEEIALKFNVSQVTISNNKNRLVRELSMQLFPNQVVDELLK